MRLIATPILLVSACHCGSSSSPWSELQSSMTAEFASQGVAVVVTCASNDETLPPRCDVKCVSDQSTIAINVVDRDGEWQWQVPDRTIDTDVIAQAAAQKYRALFQDHATVRFACGPRLRVLGDDETLDCTADGNLHALVTLGSNGVRLEILTQPDAITARHGDIDEDTLLVASHALDNSEEAGEPEDIDAALTTPIDANLAP
jgi:hypothetical protein